MSTISLGESHGVLPASSVDERIGTPGWGILVCFTQKCWIFLSLNWNSTVPQNEILIQILPTT